MASAPATRRLLTVERYERLADSIGLSELVRGEVIPLMAGGEEHSEISITVAALLWAWAKRSRRGRVRGNEAGLITERGPDTVRGIDVTYTSYKRQRRGKPSPGFSTVPPELAIEIVGQKQGWPEMLRKAAEYLRIGVDRVWIIDPKSRTLHILRPDREPQILHEPAVVEDAKILPGFKCRVREFFG